MFGRPSRVYVVIMDMATEDHGEYKEYVQTVASTYEGAKAFCARQSSPAKDKRIDTWDRRYWYWFSIYEFRLDDDSDKNMRYLSVFDWNGNQVNKIPAYGYEEDGFPGKGREHPCACRAAKNAAAKAAAQAPAQSLVQAPTMTAWMSGTVKPVIWSKTRGRRP